MNVQYIQKVHLTENLTGLISKYYNSKYFTKLFQQLNSFEALNLHQGPLVYFFGFFLFDSLT